MSLIKCHEPAKHTDKFDHCEDMFHMEIFYFLMS